MGDILYNYNAFITKSLYFNLEEDLMLASLLFLAQKWLVYQIAVNDLLSKDCLI